jgi:hypothetical protein
MSSTPRSRAAFGCIFALTYIATAAGGRESASSDGPDASTKGGSGPAPFTVATRMTGTSGYVRKHRADAVIVGERWGCTQIGSEGRWTWQCWEANSPQSGELKSPRAFAVPWLDMTGSLIAAAHHLCAFEIPGRSLRCWKRPSPGESAGRPLPDRGEWLNPHHAPFEDSQSPDRAEAAFVGGTFACLRSVKGEAWCLGNDTFGQLGSAASRQPGSGLNVPRFLGVWPAPSIALGTSHGCAIAAPNGLLQDVYASCWGRGDLGQLGGPPPDVCTVGGRSVGCARSPQKNIVLKGGMAVLGAGDQFTCVTDPEGIRCWGASRDGFFGAPGSCPKALERAWPILGGPVSAPCARCSAVPAPVSIGHGFQPDFEVGPRGLCVAQQSKVECVGAIPSPHLGGIQRVSISAGQDASACTLRDGSVFCWGEGYSRPNALNVPVAIELGSPPNVAEVAVMGATDPAGWDANCIVRTKCTISARPLGACGPDVRARDWSEVLSSASKSVSQQISVRGRLGVGQGSTTLMGCFGSSGRGCCNLTRGQLVLGGAPELLALEGFFCAGDDSQLCCNAPAFGQSVVATGELVRADSSAAPIRWRLARAVLCSDGGSGP